MLRTGDLGRTRADRSPPLPRWLVTALRPASAGPVRYWQERARLALKGSIAAAAAWALAKYAAGLPIRFRAGYGSATPKRAKPLSDYAC